MKSRNKEVSRLRWIIFKIKFKEFYEKYLRIMLFAVFDVIIEIYYSKKDRR